MYERSRTLFDCHIAGFTYYDGLDVIGQLKLGAPVSLIMEPENPYDPDAIAIYFGKAKLGYIPKGKNALISNLLYFGHGNIIESKVNCCSIESHPEHQFRIVIRIKDNRA